MVRHFQCKAEVFIKELIFDGPLGKTKHYAIRTELQERTIPYVHSFIWSFNAPNIQNEAAYTEFFEETKNAQSLDHLNDPELFLSVKTCQFHSHTRTCWEYNKNEFWFF